MRLRPAPLTGVVLVLLSLLAPPRVYSQAWVATGDESLRDAVERLVDDGRVSVPVLSWPISRLELQAVAQAAKAGSTLSPGEARALARVEQALSTARREWFVAAGDPSDLRRFPDTPRESGELGLRWRGGGNAAISGELQARVAADPADGQYLRLDGSYLAARAGNWVFSGGFQDRWWGGGYDGSLELSSNSRPVFALSLDRATSQPFESRWLNWLGPWTLGTFMGALEGRRPDSNHALLWGARVAARPLPGFEISFTRNAQFCGDKPPCGLGAFWDVLVGNDNVGESVSAAKEPGNQLATYEMRWAGRIGGFPLSAYFQHTGETIDNKIPRPLRSLNLFSFSTWGDTPDGSRWRSYLEASSTTCADFDDRQAADCGYENGLFTAGYRYRGRSLGHSTDSDTRQVVAGLMLSTPDDWEWTARLRRAEVNRIGGVPQVNQLLATGPQLWWVGEGSLARPVFDGKLELALGLEHRRDNLSRATDLEPRGYLRWTQRF